MIIRPRFSWGRIGLARKAMRRRLTIIVGVAYVIWLSADIEVLQPILQYRDGRRTTVPARIDGDVCSPIARSSSFSFSHAMLQTNLA
jgi:hypothetical protein